MDHDKSKFLTPLKVELIDQSKGLWELTAPLVFWSGFFGQEIEVPAGFITDFAREPRFPAQSVLLADVDDDFVVDDDVAVAMLGNNLYRRRASKELQMMIFSIHDPVPC